MRWICFTFVLMCSFPLFAADDAVEFKTIEAKGQPQRVRIATPQGSECHAFVSFDYEGKTLSIRQQSGNIDADKKCKLLLSIDKKTQAITIQRVEQDGVVLYNGVADNKK